jgi:hypothetical protein
MKSSGWINLSRHDAKTRASRYFWNRSLFDNMCRIDMRHSTSRILFSYWDSLRGERAAPDRGEIEPGAIRHILADTFILEIDANKSPNFRLAGTRLCALFGQEMRDQSFVNLWKPESRTEISRLVEAVMDDAAGAISGLVGTTEDGKEIDLELLLLPLRHRGKTHARMLAAISPRAVPTWLGITPVVSLDTVSLRMIWPSGRRHVAEEKSAMRRKLVVHQGGRA